MILFVGIYEFDFRWDFCWDSVAISVGIPVGIPVGISVGFLWGFGSRAILVQRTLCSAFCMSVLFAVSIMQIPPLFLSLLCRLRINWMQQGKIKF